MALMPFSSLKYGRTSCLLYNCDDRMDGYFKKDTLLAIKEIMCEILVRHL